MQRYPFRGCIECTPFAFELFGRMSDDCIELLDGLAAAASGRNVLCGLPTRAWKRIWMQKLSIALQRSLAQSVRECVGTRVSDHVEQ